MDGQPSASCSYEWRDTEWGTLRFAVDLYLDRLEPPMPLVTSSRAVVLRGDDVLCVESPDGPHIWPGGRREPGEELEQTAAREVFEETGCRVNLGRRLGRLRFTHQQPRPQHYPFPHPEFWQVVYLADAVEPEPVDWTDADGWELGAEFLPVGQVPRLDPIQRALLDQARTESDGIPPARR